MSSLNAPRDVAAVLRRRWVLPVIAVVVAIIVAFITQLATGDLGDVLVPLVVAALSGLVLGVVAILVVEAADGTIRDPWPLVRLTSAPNLAVVPRHQLGTERPEDVTMFRDPNSIEAEGYRSLRTALEFVLWPPDSRPPSRAATGSNTAAGGGEPPLRPLGDGPGKVVLVTSARPGEGKSSVAANLAAASAMAGRRVVLVDGDLRKPQVHHLFRLQNDVGLSSMLTGELKGFAAVQRLEATKHLVVVSGGPPPPDPAELLANPRLSAALASMSSQSDLVVVDAPPLLAVTDPTLIAQHCDATIMVAIAGDSDRREWAEALRRLALVEAQVIGTVLMQPDDRANAATTYRYAPSAAPKDWWVGAPPAAGTDVPSPGVAAPVDAEPVDADDSAQQPSPAEPAEMAERVDMPEPAETADTAEPADAPEPAEPRGTVRRALHRHGIAVRPYTPPRADMDATWLQQRFEVDLAPVETIAAEAGLSVATVRRAARRLGLTRSLVRDSARSRIDPAWLAERYQVDGQTLVQIAAEAGVSTSTVRRAMVAHGIARRPRPSAVRSPTR